MVLIFATCNIQQSLQQIEQVEQWTTYEIDLVTSNELPISVNEYVDIDVWQSSIMIVVAH